MSDIIDLITRKSIEEVWQRPNQDRIARFSAKPITKDIGAMRYVRSGHNVSHLPDTVNSYVVYDLGQLNPNLYGFDRFMNEWVSLEDVSNREEMFIQPLLNNRRLPLKYGYIFRTEYRTTLVAFRVDKCFGLFESFNELHITFYSNNWYNTPDGNLTTGLEVKSIEITDPTSLSLAWTSYNAANARQSNTMLFINGLYCKINALGDLKIGDYIDLIEDMSGITYYDIKLTSAPFFLSTLDNKGKYLLMAPDSPDWETVRYKDDLNIIIFNKVEGASTSGIEKGVVYDIYKDSDVRMVTHRDHSIDSVRVKNIVLAQNDDMSTVNVYARVFIKNADIGKILPDDGSYIRDMYVFDRADRKKFMVGTHAVIDQWKASVLEASPYCRWLGLPRTMLNEANLENVYSNHGLYNITEKPLKEGSTYKLPPIAFKGGLAIGYDSNFLMVDTYVIDQTTADIGRFNLPDGVEYIEFIPGRAASNGAEMESTVSTIDPQGEYAEEYYYRDSNGKWLQAKNGIHYDHRRSDNSIVWRNQYVSANKLKRNSGRYFMFKDVIGRNDIIKYFDIFSGGVKPAVSFETGAVDVWVNGRRLIRELDYQVKWPEVRVNNVEYLQNLNDVVVIAHGLYKDRATENLGFIKYGYINYDDRYKLDFNRTVDITIDGRLGIKGELNFSEMRGTATNSLYREGAPYTIRSPMYHIPIITEDKLTESRQDGLDITSSIEDYLSGLDKEELNPIQTTITHKHEIASYVLSQLIDDLNAGNIKIINDSFSPSGVASIMARYRNELEIDPGTRNDWDWEYLLLAAHNLEVSVGVSSIHHSFISKVVELYFNNRCQLNNYLHIT